MSAAPAVAVAAPSAPATARDLPPLPAGRLAFSTAVHESDDQHCSHVLDGFGDHAAGRHRPADADWRVFRVVA